MATSILLRDDHQMPPVQPLSIQMLDAKRVLHLTRTQNLSDAIVQIIGLHEQRQNNCSYILTAGGKLHGYSVRVYWYAEVDPSGLKGQTQPRDAANVATTSDAILFYYKETPQRCIFALTFGNSWHVGRPYACHSFPTQLAKRFADPLRIIELTQRGFFEQNIEITLHKPRAHSLHKTSNLFYLVDIFKCELKNDSPLYRLIIERTTSRRDRCWMQATTGGLIRFNKKLSLLDYSAILNLFEQFVNGNPVLIREPEDPVFAFLNFLQPVKYLKSRLDRLLIDDIYTRWTGQPGQRRGQLVDIRHKSLEVFLLSTNFEIKIGNMRRFQRIGSNPPSLEEVLRRIGDLGGGEGEFKRNLREGKLRFTDQNGSTIPPDVIIDFIEGPLLDAGETYFKMRKMWFLLEENYINQLRSGFETRIRENSRISSVARRMGNLLSSELAMRNTNYLVFDKVIADNIKLCDLLEYTSNDDTNRTAFRTRTVYLYHVAGESVQSTCEAATHLLNSAIMIRSVLASNFQLPNYLQRIWNLATEVSNDNMRQELRSRLESLGAVENFYELFGRRIVFVYTHLFEPDNHDFNFTLLRGNSNTTNDEVIRQRLMSFRYLEEADLNRMRAMTLPACRFHAAGRTMNAINLDDPNITNQSDRYFESLLPQIELLHLAQDLRDLNFELEFRVL